MSEKESFEKKFPSLKKRKEKEAKEHPERTFGWGWDMGGKLVFYPIHKKDIMKTCLDKSIVKKTLLETPIKKDINGLTTKHIYKLLRKLGLEE